MSVLLISDLHLQEDRPDLTRAFLQFLQVRAIHAKALYILGDFFEVWVGDDGMTAFEDEIAGALRQTAAAGTQIFLMHGNRDFLIGQQFCQIAGITLLKDPSVVDFNGEPVLLMHGDSLCTRDIAYMRLRRWLRNPISLWLLRHLPLAKRRQLARQLRNTSRQQTRQKATDIIDVTPEAIAPLLSRHGVRKLIHGHTHRPAIHDLQVQGNPAQRIVLGDWDTQGWALQIDDSGYQLASFPL